MEYEDDKQSTTIWRYDLDPVRQLTSDIGWVNAQFLRDHYFMGMNSWFSVVKKFNAWLERVAEKNKKRPLKDMRNGFVIPDSLNKQLVKEMELVWFGHVYLYQIRDKAGEIIYDTIHYIPIPKSKLSPFEEERFLPALMHLDPRSKTKDATNPKVLIQEPVDVSDSWYGYDPAQLAEVVGFEFEDALGKHGMFESDLEIMDAEAESLEVSRDYFHTIIRKLVMALNERYPKVLEEMREILESYRYIMANRTAEHSAMTSGAYNYTE